MTDPLASSHWIPMNTELLTNPAVILRLSEKQYVLLGKRSCTLVLVDCETVTLPTALLLKVRVACAPAPNVGLDGNVTVDAKVPLLTQIPPPPYVKLLLMR